jgi:uncharacterized tellurite resistance protein B-like protein
MGMGASMTLWAKFRDIVDRVSGHDGPAPNLLEEELRLAAAALLVHASTIDGDVDSAERRKLKALLQARFDLDGDAVRKLVGEADVREVESVDLYQFTSVLCRSLDQDGRKRVVEMLWEVAYADQMANPYEEHLIRKLADLLYVDHRDYITAKLRTRDAGSQSPQNPKD